MTSGSVNHTEDIEPHREQKAEKSNSFRFKEFRKRSKESLSFRRRKRHKEPGSLDSSMLSVNHPYSISPTGSRSPVSPSGHTPTQCRCRRCSLLPLEECEPKEVSALFKFLRKSKVNISFNKGYQQASRKIIRLYLYIFVVVRYFTVLI